MTFSVNTDDLNQIARVFTTASSEVAHLRAVLAGGATEPEWGSVTGDATAASSYADAMRQWLQALDQLAASLETMSHKVTVAAQHYALTESGNTVKSAP